MIVNNAGVNDGASITAGVKAFEQSLKSNLTHLYAMVHYGLEALKKSKGVIINIGSKVADTGQGGTNGYAASKGACNALTREWAVELAPYGIRCNTVIPAEVMTPLYERWIQTLDRPQETLDKICKSIPFEQRMNIEKTCMFFCLVVCKPKKLICPFSVMTRVSMMLAFIIGRPLQICFCCQPVSFTDCGFNSTSMLKLLGST